MRFFPRGHRNLIVWTGSAMIAYAAGVLWLVMQVPEIGIQASFRLTVNRVSAALIRTNVGEPPRNLINATVIAVGGEKVQTWPQWVRAIRELDEADFPEDPSFSPQSNALLDSTGQRWIKIHFRDSQGDFYEWCKVARIQPDALLPSILWFVCEVGLFLVGLLVYWKRPNERTARLFYLQSLVAIGAYIGGYHWSRISTAPIFMTIYIVCAVLLPAVNLHLFLQFASSRQIARRPALTLACVYTLPACFAVAILVVYLGVRWLVSNGASHESVNLALAWLRDVIFAYIGIAAILYVISVVVLARGYWFARDTGERNRLRLLLVGALLALLPIGYTVYMAVWHPVEFGGGAADWPMFAASLIFTLTYAVAITRYRLLQVDQLLNSGLGYVVISFFAAVVYCALVLTGMLLFGAHGPTLDQAAWVSGSALVLSIGIDAARSRLRQFLDRRYRRDKTQLDLILERLGNAVGQLVDLPTLANRLLEVSADLHGFTRGTAFIWDTGSNDFRLAAVLGADISPASLSPASPLVVLLKERGVVERTLLPPLHPARLEMFTNAGDVAVGLNHEGKLIGLLLLARGPGVMPRADDAKLLAAFAPIAALALAGAEVRNTVEALNGELQSKIEKISEQQRRILSLQQQLVSQSRRSPAPIGNQVAESQADGISPAALDSLIGSGPALQQVLDMVPKVAANYSAVLIRGDSGTGKELIAKALHDLSPRATGPFVKVHCAALAPGVLESELFGHVKGAFTGALRDKPGRFEMAHNGTIFLDEIGDINSEVQTKLLRVLQEKTFERVGSNEPIRVDVRLITATHQDLERYIRESRFRADLYYRLNVITLNMPPLRERGEDVIELAHHFLRNHAERCRKPVDTIDDEALLALRYYPWPGNIRELENAIERAVVIAEGTTLMLDDLPAEFRAPKVVSTNARPMSFSMPTNNNVRNARAVRHAREREELLEALDQAGWNRTDAARNLGLARSTLLSRMKKFGISQPS